MYFFNSFFWTKLSEKAPQWTQTSAQKADQAFERVKRWTKVTRSGQAGIGLGGGLLIGCLCSGPVCRARQAVCVHLGIAAPFAFERQSMH